MSLLHIALHSRAIILLCSEVENQHIRPAEATRCINLCEIWHGRQAPGSAWMWPKKVENFHFLVKVPRGANPSTDFLFVGL